MPDSYLTATPQEQNPLMLAPMPEYETPPLKQKTPQLNPETPPLDTKMESKAKLSRALCFFPGEMRSYGDWMKRQVLVLRLVDWVLRGVGQVMFVNNPLSGLLISGGLLLQNPWWALNGLLGTFLSTMSALVLGQNREAIAAGLHGYNGTLVGLLMCVFSAKGDWYWWLLFPNMFMSMACPIVSSALASVTSRWDLPVFTLPFNILVCIHMAATGPYNLHYPQVLIQSKFSSPLNLTTEMDMTQLVLSVPVGVGQVYGCDNPWVGGLFLLALLICSPVVCLHALVGSGVGLLSGLALGAPYEEIFSGLWGYNCALSCIAVGGMFYVLTWQSHLLAITCAFYCAYMSSAVSNVMSTFGVPACTWPFCLSTLTFLLISTKTQGIHKMPLSQVSVPEEHCRSLQQRHDLEMAEEASSPEQMQQQINFDL